MTETPAGSDPYAAARAVAAERWMPLPEVAVRMGRSESWVYDHARANDLPFPVDARGRRYWVRRADVERWERGEATPSPLAVLPEPAARSERDLALAAMDRKIADAEQELALLRAQRELIHGLAAPDRRRAAS